MADEIHQSRPKIRWTAVVFLSLVCACADAGPTWAVAARPLGAVAAEVVVDRNGEVRLDRVVVRATDTPEGSDPPLTAALQTALVPALHRSVSLGVAPGLTAAEIRTVLESMARAGVEDLALRSSASSAVGWRLGMPWGHSKDDQTRGGEGPNSALFLWKSAFSFAFEPSPDLLPQHGNVGDIPDVDALASALGPSPFRGKGGGTLLLGLSDDVPWENVLRVVDRLVDAGYDRPLIAYFQRRSKLGANDPVSWNPFVGHEPDVQDTCQDLDDLIRRRAHLPAAALSTRWGEVADPEQRGEDGRAYPVQSTVVASLVQSDGKQTLLVQCLVQDPETELAVGSAQHLVEVTNDGTITPRWPLLGVQVCCGRTWWTRPTLSSSTLVPGAVQVSGAFEDSGDGFGLEASKATLYLLPTTGPASTSLEPCETQGLVPLAGPDHLLVIEEGVVANPLQWLLRTRTRIEGGRITLTERWTPVNQPGLTGVYYETLPSGPRGKKVSTRRTIRWDTTQKRLVERCPSTPRPDASEE